MHMLCIGDRSRAARTLEGGHAGSSRRPQSPVTQAVESQFRKMMQGLTSSIEVATASLGESLGTVLQRLTHDLGGSEGGVVEQLQVRCAFCVANYPVVFCSNIPR